MFGGWDIVGEKIGWFGVAEIGGLGDARKVIERVVDFGVLILFWKLLLKSILEMFS